MTALRRRPGAGFVLQTASGALAARDVVVCTGAYQRPHRPAPTAGLPADLLQIDTVAYRRPADLPAGPVLVLGSGQSGCQIAEELHEAGRDVFLSCGRAPWLPRRLGGHDLHPDLRAVGAVVHATGYRPAYTSWMACPEAFDARGLPLQVDGASTVVDGLYLAGVHYLRKRKSSLLIGVGEDAAIIAATIAARR